VIDSSLPKAPIPGARVLVVDDEVHVRSALARSLNLLDYHALAVASGEEALRKLEEGRWDLMIVDLRMPGMDGVELMCRARRRYPELLIVVLTGHADLDSAIAAVRSDAANYLRKPVSIGELAEAAADALEKRATHVQNQRALRAIAQLVQGLDRDPSRGTGGRPAPNSSPVRVGSVLLDREKQRLVVDSHDGSLEAALTDSEMGILECLLKQPGEVVSCYELAREALDYKGEVGSKEAASIVRPHISRLRRKFTSVNGPADLIQTVRGKGYVFRPN